MELSFEEFTLAASTADLDEEPAAREHADCVEFRMDLADEPLAALETYDGQLPILATNRSVEEGGAASGPSRLESLAEVCAFDAVAAVDVELASVVAGDVEEVQSAAADGDVSVVVSAHDFEATPSQSEIETILRQAGRAGDVAKFASTAADLDDALSLLSATRTLTTGGAKVATMAMGAAGSHTRAVAPVYGSKIGYAPVDPDRATAPGQYDLRTLRNLVDTLSTSGAE